MRRNTRSRRQRRAQTSHGYSSACVPYPFISSHLSFFLIFSLLPFPLSLILSQSVSLSPPSTIIFLIFSPSSLHPLLRFGLLFFCNLVLICIHCFALRPFSLSLLFVTAYLLLFSVQLLSQKRFQCIYIKPVICAAAIQQSRTEPYEH